MKTPAQGASTSIYLASAPDLEQVRGRYFADSKPKTSAQRSYDEAAARRLWQVSADLIGLTATTDTPSQPPPVAPENLRRNTPEFGTKRPSMRIVPTKTPRGGSLQ